MFFLIILFCLLNFLKNVCDTNSLNLHVHILNTQKHFQYLLHNNYTITPSLTSFTLIQIKFQLVSLLKLHTHLPLHRKPCLSKYKTNVSILNYLIYDHLCTLKTRKYIRVHNSYYTLISASLNYVFNINIVSNVKRHTDNYVFLFVIILFVEEREKYVNVNNMTLKRRLFYLYYG